MSQVTQGALDRILAQDSNYAVSEALKGFFEEHDTITLRVEGDALDFVFRRKRYQVKPGKDLIVSPRLGVELLALHGRGGTYYLLDPRLGVHRDRFDYLPPSQQDFYKRKKPKYQEAYLYHYEGGEDEEELSGGSQPAGTGDADAGQSLAPAA